MRRGWPAEEIERSQPIPRGASSCVQGRSEETPASIKRHPGQNRYNSLPWIWQPQQLRQRLTPLRRTQSSGASGRSVSMTSVASCAGNAAAPASASTASSATNARSAAAPAYASTVSSAPNARRAAASAFASTESGATNARRAVAPASAPTASSAPNVQNARTSHAPWKAAHYLATVSAQPKCC